MASPSLKSTTSKFNPTKDKVEEVYVHPTIQKKLILISKEFVEDQSPLLDNIKNIKRQNFVSILEPYNSHKD
jgi:hypothetical protein